MFNNILSAFSVYHTFNIPLVSFEIHFSEIFFFLFIKLEWLFTDTDNHVISEVLVLNKILLAYATVEWLLTSVNPYVSSVANILTKTSLTYFTLEWLFTGVDPHVCSEVLFLLKPHSSVWILMCVVRSPLVMKPCLHMSHLNDFSPVWILMCLVRS